jgi:hypothetical protein
VLSKGLFLPASEFFTAFWDLQEWNHWNNYNYFMMVCSLVNFSSAHWRGFLLCLYNLCPALQYRGLELGRFARPHGELDAFHQPARYAPPVI